MKSVNFSSKVLSFLFVAFLPFMLSCESREVKEIKKMLNRRLDLDGAYLFFDSCMKYTERPGNNSIRIVTTVSYNYCYECMFKPLYALETIVSNDSILLDNITILAFVDSINIEEAQETLSKLKLKSVIAIDKEKEFSKKNNLDELLHRNRTFVIDKNDRIVFVGNPVM